MAIACTCAANCAAVHVDSSFVSGDAPGVLNRGVGIAGALAAPEVLVAAAATAAAAALTPLTAVARVARPPSPSGRPKGRRAHARTRATFGEVAGSTNITRDDDDDEEEAPWWLLT